MARESHSVGIASGRVCSIVDSLGASTVAHHQREDYVVSSVSAEAYSINAAAGFRVKRAEDGAIVAAGPHTTPLFALPTTEDRPTIIVVLHTHTGSDLALAEAIERASSRSLLSDSALGFTRAIPESAVPAVRETLALLRSQVGYAGSITAFAVERPAIEKRALEKHGVGDSRRSQSSADVRDRSSLEFNELSIDPARREVWVEGSLIGLTKSEFDLLYVLAQRPGVVFSRRQIVLAYKGADYPVDDRSIDVQMFNLRRKIRSAGSTLQTIRGVGYRFTGTTRS